MTQIYGHLIAGNILLQTRCYVYAVRVTHCGCNVLPIGVLSKWSFLPFLCLTQYFINRTTQNIENNRFRERLLRNLLIIVLRQTVFVCSNVAPNTKGLRTNQSVHIGLKFMSLQLSNFRIHVQIYEKSVDKPL